MKKLVVLAIFTMFVAGIASAQTSDNTIPLVDGFEDGDISDWNGNTNQYVVSSGFEGYELDDYYLKQMEFQTGKIWRPIIGEPENLSFHMIRDNGNHQITYRDSNGDIVMRAKFYEQTPKLRVHINQSGTMNEIVNSSGSNPEYYSRPTGRMKISFNGIDRDTKTINEVKLNYVDTTANEITKSVSNVSYSSDLDRIYLQMVDSIRAKSGWDNIVYGVGQLPAIESASNQPVDAGEMVSYQADISSINPEQTSNGVNVTVTTGDGTQVTEAEMTYNSTSGLWEANGIHNAYDGVEYSYEFEAFNQYGTNTESGSFRTNTPSFITGQAVQGTVEGTYSLNPDYEYTDGDVEYYYEKKYVYHNGDIVEEGNWERINLAGSSSAVDYTVSQSFERQTEATGNYSIETKVVKASSTYNWDADGDGEYTVDSGQWRDYNFETIGTVRYNYQVVSAMETPSPLDALGGFFTDIVGGIIDTITGIFQNEPTAVPQPGTPPTPATN